MWKSKFEESRLILAETIETRPRTNTSVRRTQWLISTQATVLRLSFRDHRLGGGLRGRGGLVHVHGVQVPALALLPVVAVAVLGLDGEGRLDARRAWGSRY